MYENGRVPLGLLVARPCAGKDMCLMMPGTAGKFDLLVKLAQAEFGWTPVVSGPSDGYRTIGMQQQYWDTMPYPMAAYPGTSSHGGTYNGVEAGALDIGNWGAIGQEAFFDLSRRAGFQPGYFDGTGGRPDEPWHIIDWSPWDAPEVPDPPAPATETSEEDDMFKPSLFSRGTAAFDGSLIHPDFGVDLKPGDSRTAIVKDGGKEYVVRTFRGFMVTNSPAVFQRWAYMYAPTLDLAKVTAPGTDADKAAAYIGVQAEATRVSLEMHGDAPKA